MEILCSDQYIPLEKTSIFTLKHVGNYSRFWQNYKVLNKGQTNTPVTGQHPQGNGLCYENWNVYVVIEHLTLETSNTQKCHVAWMMFTCSIEQSL